MTKLMKRPLDQELTRGDLIAWAEAQDDETIVGYACDRGICPIARCVNDLYELPKGYRARAAGKVWIAPITDSSWDQRDIPTTFSPRVITSAVDERGPRPLAKGEFLAILRAYAFRSEE